MSVHPRCVWLMLLALLCGPSASPLAAQQPDSVSPGRLKQLSLEQLMNIEVTSVSRRAETLAQAASAIQVITAEDIRRSGSRSVPEALRLAPNLEVAQIDSRTWAISARGFNGTTANKLLVLIDGRTVYTPLFSGVFWDVQNVPMWEIDRIEVISGPGATLWGANAVNGVINIITKHAGDTQGFYGAAGAGTELRGFGGVRWGGRAGEALPYRVHVRGFSRDASVLPDGSDARNEWYLGQAGFRADWDPSPAQYVSVQGEYYDGRASLPAADDLELRGGNLMINWRRAFSRTSAATLQVYWDRTYRLQPGTFAERLDTYDVDFQQELTLGRHHALVWGFGYRLINDWVENSPALAFLPPHVTRDWVTGFVQDEVTLIPERLTVAVGTKIEHNDYTGVEVQPSIRASLRTQRNGTFWTGLSHAVRTPSRIDREFFVPGQPPYIVAGGAGFESEKLIAYELGWRFQPEARLLLSLATYYNWYDDLRSVERVNPPQSFPVVIANGWRGTSYGAELAADFRVTEHWNLKAGYVEFRLDLEQQPGSNDTTGARSEAADPERQALLRSSWDLPRNLTLDAMARYVGRVAATDVPAYAELDVRLGWQPLPNLQLSVRGQNLLHDQHPEFGAPLSRLEIERGVFGEVVWQF